MSPKHETLNIENQLINSESKVSLRPWNDQLCEDKRKSPRGEPKKVQS